MIAALILLLAVLWVFGYVHIAGFVFPTIPLFAINGQTVTLLDLLIFALVVWAVSILPTPFREIAGALLILWVLAVLGILSLTGFGLPSILVFAIIVGLIISLFNRPHVL